MRHPAPIAPVGDRRPSITVITAPSNSVRALIGAPSRGLHALCVRFAAGVTPGPRNTRFPLVANLDRAGLSPAGSRRRFPACLSLYIAFPPSPSFAWRNEMTLAWCPKRTRTAHHPTNEGLPSTSTGARPMSVGSAGTGADCKKISQAIFPAGRLGQGVPFRHRAAPPAPGRDGSGVFAQANLTLVSQKNVVFLQQSSNTDFRGPPDSPRHARSEPHCYAGVDSDTLPAPSQSQNPGRTQT